MARSYDLKKDLRHLYQPPTGRWVEVDVPTMTYLAVDGHGDPNVSPRYAEAVAALFRCGYAVRRALRERSGDVFVVGPLEGLWWSDDPTSFVERRKDDWAWTMLIGLPDVVTPGDIETGLAAASGDAATAAVGDVRAATLTEGRSLHVMHVGSYEDEGPLLASLHDHVMPERGLTFNGPHHEIYLGDPRRVPPQRLRTVLRQPVVTRSPG